MPTNSILGVSQSPEYDRDAYDVGQVDRETKEAKLDRKPELNDPVVQAAITAMEEVGESGVMGKRFDVQWERNSGTVVFTVYDDGGEKVVRQIPPEEAIRMAQHLKEQRAHMVDQLF